MHLDSVGNSEFAITLLSISKSLPWAARSTGEAQEKISEKTKPPFK